MNVVPKGSPLPTGAPSPAQEARARAIAKLTGGTESIRAAEQPVPNATKVAPEEMTALSQPSETKYKEESADTDPPASAAPEADAPKAEKEDPLSSQYATLARKERALRNQVQQFKAEQEKFKAEQARLAQTPAAPEIDMGRYVDRDRLKSDPLAVFAEAGLSYDEIVEQVLNQQNFRTDPRISAQMEKLEAEVRLAREEAKALRDAQENNQQQTYKQAVAQIRSDAAKLAFTDPNFEMIKATNSVNDVVELIEETFKADGTLLSVEEACQAVEDHLLEEAMKLSKVKKLQQRLAAPAAPQKPANKSEQPQTQKTLTNSMNAPKLMSARDRAIAAMQGKITK